MNDNTKGKIYNFLNRKLVVWEVLLIVFAAKATRTLLDWIWK